MKYTQRSINELKPYKKNARTHTPEQIQKVADSIREFGFLNPVLVDKNDGIIAGHGRIEAAKLLGLKTVPVLHAEHLTEAQKRAYVIADNRLAEIGTDWDFEILKEELQALESLDFDVCLTGFEPDIFKQLSLKEGAEENRVGYPWDSFDNIKNRSDLVHFSFGVIEAKLSAELAENFAEKAPEVGVKEWLEALLYEAINR